MTLNLNRAQRVAAILSNRDLPGWCFCNGCLSGLADALQTSFPEISWHCLEGEDGASIFVDSDTPFVLQDRSAYKNHGIFVNAGYALSFSDAKQLADVLADPDGSSWSDWHVGVKSIAKELSVAFPYFAWTTKQNEDDTLFHRIVVEERDLLACSSNSSLSFSRIFGS